MHILTKVASHRGEAGRAKRKLTDMSVVEIMQMKSQLDNVGGRLKRGKRRGWLEKRISGSEHRIPQAARVEERGSCAGPFLKEEEETSRN